MSTVYECTVIIITFKDVFRLRRNSLKKKTKSLAHIMWRNDIALMLNGYWDLHSFELCTQDGAL